MVNQGPELRVFQSTPRGPFVPGIELLNDERFPVCLYFLSTRTGERFDVTLTPECVEWFRAAFDRFDGSASATTELPVVRP